MEAVVCSVPVAAAPCVSASASVPSSSCRAQRAVARPRGSLRCSSWRGQCLQLVGAEAATGGSRSLSSQPIHERMAAVVASDGKAPSVSLTDEEEGGERDESPLEVDIKVEGMVCDGCSSRVRDALKANPAVLDAEVSLERKVASVKLASGNMIDAMELLPSLLAAVEEIGFQAEPDL
eukprot:jgi/Chlat1/5905/Chrsp4S06401